MGEEQQQQHFLGASRRLVGEDNYPRVQTWWATLAPEARVNLLARYFMAPENERPEFLSQLYSYASAPAPPPAAAALTPSDSKPQ